ncbi:MAG: signal peptidase I [Eggerthellaceae bacterium]|jgi:signal peptidase I
MATERKDVALQGEEEKKGLSLGASLLLMIVIVAVAYFALRTFVVGTYEIPSASMEDTIQIGDRIFSEKITYYTSDPQQGDIITFTDPQDSSRTLIKRVIAVGGQTVDLKNGAVYVDGKKLDEPYTEGKPSYPLETAPGVEITYPFTVPDGYLWVMGDNRTNSADSRYFGAIDKDSVTGHAAFRFWPLDRVGTLD